MRTAAALTAFLLLAIPTLGIDIVPATTSAQDLPDQGRERPGAADPCDLLLAPRGEAYGLSRRCETQGGGGGVARGDFNADGFGDLAVSAPYENIDGALDAGAVHVIYGSVNGLQTTGNQMVHGGTGDVRLVPYALFGYAIAAGDFNDDGFSDLAVGAPNETGPGGEATKGAVYLFRGSATGLGAGVPLRWAEHVVRRDILRLDNAQFGMSLVASDFDRDGNSDLAVGAPNAAVATILGISFTTGAGAVLVFNSGFYDQQFPTIVHQNTGPIGPYYMRIGDLVETGDRFGSSLVATSRGLVIGVPLEDVGSITDAGAIHFVENSPDTIVYGSFTDVPVTQDTAGVQGVAEAGDQFGRVLASGSLGGGRDLAVGIPYEDGGAASNSGAVQVFSTLDFTNDLQIEQSALSGVASEAGDQFGFALAIGNFDGAGDQELAVGVPGEDIGTVSNAGLVNIIRFDSQGAIAGQQTWYEGVGGLLGVTEASDKFGSALSAWDYGLNGFSRYTDLAIGIPFQNIGAASDAGAVQVLYGGATGLRSTGNQVWHQNSAGIIGTSEAGDQFGHAVY